MRIHRGEALLLRVLTLTLGAVLMMPRPTLACSMLLSTNTIVQWSPDDETLFYDESKFCGCRIVKRGDSPV